MGSLICWAHFKATLYRRCISIRRNLGIFTVSCILTIIFSFLAVLINFLMSLLYNDEATPITFNSFKQKSNDVYVIKDNTTHFSDEMVDILKEMYLNDTKENLTVTYFDSREALNAKMYQDKTNMTGPDYVNFGVQFISDKPIYKMIDFLNGTVDEAINISAVRSLSIQMHENPSYYTELQLTRMVWKARHGKENDFRFSETQLIKKLMDMMFGSFCPLMMTCGLNAIISTIISQPITDLTSEMRPYMMSCSMTLFPYWLSMFLLDNIIYIVVAVITWAVFIIFKVDAVVENQYIILYAILMGGPSFILSVYCFSFMFSNADNAARNLYIVSLIILIWPMTADIVYENNTPLWHDILFTIIPHINTERLIAAFMTNISFLRKDFSEYWKNANSAVHLYMQFGGVAMYAFILYLIEKLRIVYKKRKDKKEFEPYKDVFLEVRSRIEQTEETVEMENEVHNSHDFAVRIENVSRLFFNTKKDPIAAVNNVSLGVKKGSIFGFLGANGAGKTTLIKMITQLMPISNGSIEVDGMPIGDETRYRIAVCPQFNTHLSPEMTPSEHFKFYGWIHKLDDEQARASERQLMEILELWKYKDKPVREMSGGQQRKLAVALSFYGPSDIVLLDEPTSSLDPYARHTVHELIKEFKGRKTYLLCTHLLSEAEQLCDTISIMMHGLVYTVGTPQYLSAKFGTEYRIDALLRDDEEAGRRFDAFMEESLPTSVLNITRPNARIYSVPAQDITLADLMHLMEEGQRAGNGSQYFTCSNSSLERVFLEIVRMSENDELINNINKL